MSELRNIRRARGLTQEELADAINTTGVSISRYERDERKLTLPLLRRLSTVLNCSISEIIGGTGEQFTTKDSSSHIHWVEYCRLDQITFGEPGLNTGNCDGQKFPVSDGLIGKLGLVSSEDLLLIELVNCGDAMSPLLEENDHVLLDQGTTGFTRDGIYLIQSGPQPEFRRLAKVPASQDILVLSDNPAHPDHPNIPANEIRILGLAIWHCSRV